LTQIETIQDSVNNIIQKLWWRH